MTVTRMRITDPADGSPVGEVPVADAAQVRRAVGAARTAARGWARTAPADRAERVAAAADEVERAAARLADLSRREMGRPTALAAGGVAAAVATLRQYAELGPLHGARSLQGGWDAADFMVREPRGVVGCLTPWNDPVAVPAQLVAAALVTGNVVVLKPSERTPHTGAALGAAMAAALPEGVLQVVPGDAATGAALVEADVDVVAHVGSSASGRRIRELAAARGTKVLVENGGCDPLVVDADVDPAWAAEQAALGAFLNSGQICTSVERVYVHASLADAFLGELVKAAEALVPGPTDDPATTLGPLVDERMRATVHGQVVAAQAAGAATLTGGFVPEGPGCYYPATVLASCTQDMAVVQEETFGPVAPVVEVADFDEGLALAADSAYGLAAVVLTGSLLHAQRAWRELPVGTVKVNGAFGGAPGGAAHPRGASGDGFGYGPELLDEMTVVKAVHLGQPR